MHNQLKSLLPDHGNFFTDVYSLTGGLRLPQLPFNFAQPLRVYYTDYLGFATKS